MTSAGEYLSPQKAAVRQRIWDAAFERSMERKRVENLRYLCLPGSKCIYLQSLENRFGFPKTGFVAVEKRDNSHTAIHTYLRGQGVVLLGSYEDLLEAGEIVPYFPFDVINLDFCGQGFVFPDLSRRPEGNQYMRRWEAIESTLRLQAEHKRSRFEFLLTLAGQRDNGPGQRFLADEIERIQTRLNAPMSEPTKAWQAVARVVPKIVADLALKLQYKVESFDIMGYRQSHSQYDMVAFGFGFVRVEERLGNSAFSRASLLDEFLRLYCSKELDYLSE